MKKSLLMATAVLALSSSFAFANETLSIEAKGGKFEPATLTAKAGEKIEINVKNSEEKAVIEFENKETKVEMDINPNTTQKIVVGPLEAGEYVFFNDENPEAHTNLTVK